MIRPLIPTVSRMEKDYDKLQHFYMHGNRLMKKRISGPVGISERVEEE